MMKMKTKNKYVVVEDNNESIKARTSALTYSAFT